MEGQVIQKESETCPILDALDNLDLNPENEIENFKFDPPLYKQRYIQVSSIIKDIFDGKECKLLEFGCAELKVFRMYKAVPCFTNITFVDIDESLLESRKQFVEPFSSDYISCFRREKALNVKIYAGDISIPSPIFKDHDVVVGIEVIEHLVDDVLKRAVEVIFGFIRPQVVIFTTPNSEFNVYFPDLKGFRHDDHKFEWTRQEFETWCHGIGEVYGYSCDFSGVGEGPDGCMDNGYCSQIVLFKLVGESSLKSIEADHSHQFKLIQDCTYPAKLPSSRYDDIVYETNCRLLSLARCNQDYLDGDEVRIDIRDVIEAPRLKQLEVYEFEIKDALQRLKFDTEEEGDKTYILVCNQPCKSDESDEEM